MRDESFSHSGGLAEPSNPFLFRGRLERGRRPPSLRPRPRREGESGGEVEGVGPEGASAMDNNLCIQPSQMGWTRKSVCGET